LNAQVAGTDPGDRILPSSRDLAVRQQKSSLTRVDRTNNRNKKAETEQDALVEVALVRGKTGAGQEASMRVFRHDAETKKTGEVTEFLNMNGVESRPRGH
jgi:hypothetical protein